MMRRGHKTAQAMSYCHEEEQLKAQIKACGKM
jgi:hypothetical protein